MGRSNIEEFPKCMKEIKQTFRKHHGPQEDHTLIWDLGTV